MGPLPSSSLDNAMTSTTPFSDRTKWTEQTYHRNRLFAEADGLFDFFQDNSINPKGGFFDLDEVGNPLNAEGQIRQIHMAARAVHCFSVGALLNRPGAVNVVDHGMDYIW